MSAAAGLLQGFHAIIALQRQEPHWLLNDADAKRYGQALANALRHVPVRAAQKTIDYACLVFVAFEMEAPRVARSAFLARNAREPVRPTAVVYPFAAPAPPPASGPIGAAPQTEIAEPPAEPA